MPDILALDLTADDQKLLAQTVGYYHETLKNSPDALAYLQSRGITNGSVIDTFRVGYADRTLGPMLPSKESKAGRNIRGRLEALGLFRASGHEHFVGCVIFPILAADGTGRIVNLYGRKTLGTRLRRGTVLDVFLTDQQHGVWNIQAFTAAEEIILCASLFDALTFWNHGYRNVTCTFGPDALTDDHLTAFQEFKIRRVLMIHEGIAPGLLAAGLDCYHLALPNGIDVNRYALQVSDPTDALGAIIRKAEWLGNGTPSSAPVTAALTTTSMPILDAEPTPDDYDEAEEELFEEPEPAICLASPLPPAPPALEAEVKDDEVLMMLGNRRYRIRGWTKNLSFDQLKVNVLVHNDVGMFVDTFDLYAAKHRKAFVIQAAQELNVEVDTIKKDVGKVLLKLEELQDKQITQALAPKETHPQMSDEESEAALHLLRDPQLLNRIVEDFDIVGERTNKLVGYLAAISRKLDEPLAVIVQSSTAAGKTSLMDAVLSFVPPEDLVKYSAMTGQSLFYMGATNLQHKILAIVEEEGAERASYALKLLQSEGELTIASTGKDATSGRLTTQEYHVEGPVMIFLTTTSVQVDEELLNRCLVLTVSEERDQTRAIHEAQRRRQTLNGLLARQDREQKRTLHRNAQRLLRPLLVANPHAESLTFLDAKTRTRRDHVKYLTLIRAVALLHQHQRPIKTINHNGQKIEYIDATFDDIAIANDLAHEVLGRSLDELPPQTRCLLNLIDTMVSTNCQCQGLDRTDYRFSRRDVREFTGWGHSQLAIHLRRLEELEYLLIHRGSRGRSFVYELLYAKPQNGREHFLTGLIDMDRLRCNLPASNGQNPETLRAQSGPVPASIRPSESDETPCANEPSPGSSGQPCENAHLDRK